MLLIFDKNYFLKKKYRTILL